MQVVNPLRIASNATVLGEPDASAIDTIMQAVQSPATLVGADPTAPVQLNRQPITQTNLSDTAQATNLISSGALASAQAATAEPAPSNTIRNIALVGAGIGALLLVSKNGKEKVSGTEKEDHDYLPWLLLLGGGAALWWFSSKGSTTTAAQTPVIADQGYQIQEITANPITVADATVQAGRSATAATDLQVLQRDWPAVSSTLDKMTDAEILAMYQYYYGWVLYGKKLYAGPNPAAGSQGLYTDGTWNPDVYAAIAAIKAKYSLSI